MEVLINEIFVSIQGESTYAGEVCVFVRFVGCNLRCRYCDTKYAYDKGDNLDINEVVEKVVSYGVNLVEITGGEPLLQEEAVKEIVKKLLDRGHRVLLETNGTVSLKKWKDGQLGGVVKIMDVKCPSSGCESDLGNLKYLNVMDEVKFVIGTKRDYEYAKEVIESHILSATVLFSPVWKPKVKKKLAEWIIEDKLNVVYQLQLHKILKLK